MKNQPRKPGDGQLSLAAILSIGFRPFFLAAGVWGVVAIGLWWCILQGYIFPPLAMDSLAWHRHEMLFGYFGAVVAGFLLTAIPNWTGRTPIGGTKLSLLVILWICARLSALFGGVIGPVAGASFDLAFFLMLSALAAKEIVAAKNRNLPIPVVVLILAIASTIDHAEARGLMSGDGLGWRLAVGMLVVLVAVIGGRIIPTFTRNWLNRQKYPAPLPAATDKLDLATVFITLAALLAWAIAPEWKASGVALLSAGALNLVRLARWSGRYTFSDPLLSVLHVAFAWLPVGLALLGASVVTDEIPRSSALHALGVGALGLMTVAVMTRATLGHTGRALKADGATIAAYVCLLLGALVRTSASLIGPWYQAAINTATTLWIASFVLFVLSYGPKLLGQSAKQS